MIRFTILLLVFLWVSAPGQHVIGTREPVPLYHRHFNMDHGLPSNEAYFVYADRDGMIWICTDNGVARFDGVQFTNYGEDHGLCSYVIFGCNEDKKGGLWFYSYTGELSRYDRREERFLCPGFNDSLVSLVHGAIIQALRFDGDTMFVVTSSSLVKVWSSGDVWAFENCPARDGEMLIHVLSNGEPVVVLNSPRGNKTFDLHIRGRYNDSIQGLCLPGGYYGKISAEAASNGRLFAIAGENLVTYDPVTRTCQLELLPFANTPSLCRKNDALLCGSFNRGLWQMVPGRDSTVLKQLLNEISVSCAAIDWQGGIWASSPTDGLYYIPTEACVALTGKTTISTEKVKSMFQIGDTVCYLTYDGRLNTVYDSRGTIVHDRLLDMSSVNTTAWPAGRKLFIRAGTEFLYDPATRAREIPNDRSSFSKKPDEAAIAIRNDSAYVTCAKEGRFWNIPLIAPWDYGRVTASAVSPGGKAWLGTIYDLFVADPAEPGVTSIAKRNGLHRLSVRCLLPLGGDSVLAGTSTGLHLIHGNRVLVTLTAAEGLSAGKVLSVARRGDVIYVGTARGIDRIDGLFSANRKVTSLSRDYGVPVCPATHLAFASDHLVAGTDYGIFVFRLGNIIDKTDPITVRLSGVFAGEPRTLVPGQPLRLSYRNNTVRVSYAALNFRNAMHNEFRYRLFSAGNGKWLHTPGQTVSFQELIPGTYTLDVQAKNPDGSWSPGNTNLVLMISPPLWQTPWFLVVAALLLLLTSYLIFRLRVRRIRQLAEIRDRLSESRMQALGMQLNPHFVYNALNSVSSHMARNDARFTLRFLGKFGKLMRLVFRNSQQTLITVEEEIETLRLYIDMESARLDKELEFTIHVDENIDAESLMLPSLLLQPLVENAIWHGVSELPGKRCIDVCFTRSETKLEVSICDNGRGFAPEALNKTSATEKHSLEIIGERLDLLGAHYRAPASIEITDRRKYGAAGTMARVVLPLIRSSVLSPARL